MNLISYIVSVLEQPRRALLKRRWFTSTLLPALPRSLRWKLRRVYFAPSDFLERLVGRPDPLVPPKSAIYCGAVSAFASSGDTLRQRVIELAGLSPECRVLDIGCGMGRLAAPLTRYLDQHGSYTGLDIVPSAIDWCKRNITRTFPNFTFALADVLNREYNPSGRIEASAYRFPYPDDSFDVVVLMSVFTHMLAPAMENYIHEISRVLASGGRCFATYYLINAESEQLMRAGTSVVRFVHRAGPCWLVSTTTPELSVAYDESFVRGAYQRCGLFDEPRVHYGGWSGRPALWAPESGLGDQDIVVIRKAQR